MWRLATETRICDKDSCMETITTRTKVSDDGHLTIAVPALLRGAEVDVVVVVQKTGDNGSSESLGWPAGFFDRVFGSIHDEKFKRWPQGIPEPPPDFE